LNDETRITGCFLQFLDEQFVGRGALHRSKTGFEEEITSCHEAIRTGHHSDPSAVALLRVPQTIIQQGSAESFPFVLAIDHQAMDDKVTLRLDGSPRMTARGILDHPDIAEFA